MISTKQYKETAQLLDVIRKKILLLYYYIINLYDLFFNILITFINIKVIYELLNHFSTYRSISQINKLYIDMNAIQTRIKSQIFNEFEAW